MTIWLKHCKLWHKFIANCLYFQVSGQRVIIKLFKAVWFLLVWPLELVGDLLVHRSAVNDLGQSPKILIVKIDQLGDLLFSTFLLPIIKEAYPDSQVDYLINPSNQVILDKNSQVNQVYYWQNWLLKNIPGRSRSSLFVRSLGVIKDCQKNYSQWRQLRQQNYDLVINARAFWPSSNWPWWSLGRYLVAFDISQSSYLANYLANYQLTEEEWVNYLELLKPLAIDPLIINQYQPRGQFFNQLPVDNLPASYWCLSAVSFDSERTWPIDQWVELIQGFLVNQPNSSLILTGLASQANWLKQITDQFIGQPRVISLTNLTIPQLASLLKNSQGLIAIDSFAVHLAIALNKQVISLVNSHLFYVKGLSLGRLVDGRSMIPLLDNVLVYDLQTTTSQQLLEVIKKQS